MIEIWLIFELGFGSLSLQAKNSRRSTRQPHHEKWWWQHLDVDMLWFSRKGKLVRFYRRMMKLDPKHTRGTIEDQKVLDLKNLKKLAIFSKNEWAFITVFICAKQVKISVNLQLQLQER